MTDKSVKWSRARVLERLHDIVATVPTTQFGIGAGSASVTPLVTAIADYEVVQTLTREVLTAVLTPAPDPEFGDDGFQAERREGALKGLAWAEQWVEVVTGEAPHVRAALKAADTAIGVGQ